MRNERKGDKAKNSSEPSISTGKHFLEPMSEHYIKWTLRIVMRSTLNVIVFLVHNESYHFVVGTRV